MTRVGIQMKIREEKIEEYKEWHRKVWPELLDIFRQNSWKNFSIFMRPDGLIFLYVEVPETFAKAVEAIAGEEINTKWQEMMAPYFEILEGSRPDQAMMELEEIFHTD